MRTAIDSLASGALRDRAALIGQTYEDLTWCESRQGQVYSLHDGLTTEIYLTLFHDREVRYLPTSSTFQTEPHDDGSIRINVRTVAMTPLWAGLGLFHELSHAYDFHSGIEPTDPTEGEYRAGEARAYHLEMAILDVLTSGRLTAALEPITGDSRVDPRELAILSELADKVERQTTGANTRPPASDNEMAVRDGLVKAAIIIASHTGIPNPAQIERAEDAAQPLGDFLRAGIG